jgi:Fur family ferric uptake transcriptional regulator
MAVTSAQDYAERLRVADLRVTRPRVAFLGVLYDQPHADTETIVSGSLYGFSVDEADAIHWGRCSTCSIAPIS